jgi:hypothetical protein
MKVAEVADEQKNLKQLDQEVKERSYEWDDISVPVQAKTKREQKIYPLLVFFALGLRSEKSLKNHIFYQK